MSKNYNNTFNIILIAFTVVAFLPVLLLSMIFYVLLSNINIKSKYVLYTSIAFLITIIIVDTSFFENFFILEQTRTIATSISKIFKGNIFYILDISKFTIYNWLFMCLYSIIFSSYLKKHRDKIQKKEKAGITTLDTEIDKISNVSKKTKSSKDDNIFFGTSNKQKVYCDYNHTFIAGTTGAGKTVLLSNFIKSAIERQQGCLIVDGKGDMGDGSILEITQSLCKKYNRKLYIINMTDIEKSNIYNPFIGANATTIKDMLINLTDWSEEHYKLNTERYLQRVIKLLLLKYDKLSLELITKYINDRNFIDLSKELAEKNLIRKEQHAENTAIAKTSSDIAKSAEARFATLLESELNNIFNENGVDIYNALAENAVILFVLNPLMYPETSQALGRLVMIDSKKAVSKLFNTNNKRTLFLFDEINTYISDVLLNLINKSRSAKVTCCCAMQSLSDINTVSEDFKNQLIENCNNFIIMRQNSPSSAEQCSEIIGTVEKMKMTYQVGAEEQMGKGSARKTREFIIHPDQIKSLENWHAFYLSKKMNKVKKVQVNKPF